MPIWWAVTFSDGQAGKSGYLAWSSDRSQQLGLYFTDGTPVPAHPSYGYTPSDTNAAAPSWASVHDPAPPSAEQPTVTLSTGKFILLFTPAEAQAIRASTDPIVQQFFLAATSNPTIELTDTDTQRGIGYLAMVGLIAPERVPQILSGQAHG